MRVLLLCLCLTVVSPAPGEVPELPWREAGLTREQAAVFLQNRLTFGPTKAQTEAILSQGLEQWVEQQLRGELPEDDLQARLDNFSSLTLPASEVRQQFIPRRRLVEKAEKDGLVAFSDGDEKARQLYERELKSYKEERGLATYDDLSNEIRGQKLVRACYARNQLREVLVDFWFNHFNVAMLSDEIRINTLPYERDILRPHALGRFETLLQRTARHPAMLFYLNNNVSSAPPQQRTTLNFRYAAAPPEEQEHLRAGQPLKRKAGGLNENFAREVMELHTLGVDGGYSQQDVTEVARCLSGWTVLYEEGDNAKLRALIEPGSRLGYIHQGDFLFRADWHDAEPKTVLGAAFPEGGGLEEGVAVLQMLAQHPATSRFVSRKLAQRFVCDEPPVALVERLAERFRNSSGDVRSTLTCLVQSPEFWAEASRPTKLKSPLEFFVSTLRITGADYAPDPNHFYWLTRLGQPLYACAPPTGYPENSREWASTNSLVQRMNFANQLVQNRLPRVKVEWPVASLKEEPVTRLAAMLVPERSVPVEALSVQKMGQPGDGYPPERFWFRPRPPADLAQRRQQAIAMKVASVLLGSPAFQLR
jgi:uncharacterized protein (DUF1800 family)